MNIQLEHSAKNQCHVWDELLSETTFSKFCSRIEKFAKKIAESPLEDMSIYFSAENFKTGRDKANKFKGDVFEIFCEMVIRLSPIDDRIGISEYHVVTEGDTGVDGYGISRDGLPITVQIKYRKWDDQLDAEDDHLNNFRMTSYSVKFDIKPQSEGKMLIITSGDRINWRTLDEQFLGKIRCISRNASYGCIKGSQRKTVDGLFSLQTLVDNNVVFWNSFRESLR